MRKEKKLKNRPPRRVQVNLGEIHAYKIGAQRFSLRDPYYLVLTISWPVFFTFAVLFYLGTNLFFGLAYYLEPGCINNARPGVFLDHFFFSIETLATVGYGEMSPATIYGHIVASIEIIFGMMSMAVITGLVFTRFSRPRSRILFSATAVVTRFDGQTSLMLRVVNERNQPIADVTARLTVLRRVRILEGKSLRRFIDLKLERPTAPMIGLSWTLVHVINEQSPLWGITAEDLLHEDASLLASISGYDESISATVVARKTYPPSAIRFGHEFVDIIERLETGETMLDMTRFHDTVEVVVQDEVSASEESLAPKA